jgi:hypothetical protein
MLRKRTGEGGKKASWAADNAKIPEYGVNGKLKSNTLPFFLLPAPLIFGSC